MGSYIKLCIYMPSLKILRNVYLTVNLYLKILACNRVLFFVFFLMTIFMQRQCSVSIWMFYF